MGKDNQTGLAQYVAQLAPRTSIALIAIMLGLVLLLLLNKASSGVGPGDLRQRGQGLRRAVAGARAGLPRQGESHAAATAGQPRRSRAGGAGPAHTSLPLPSASTGGIIANGDESRPVAITPSSRPWRRR